MRWVQVAFRKKWKKSKTSDLSEQMDCFLGDKGPTPPFLQINYRTVQQEQTARGNWGDAKSSTIYQWHCRQVMWAEHNNCAHPLTAVSNTHVCRFWLWTTFIRNTNMKTKRLNGFLHRFLQQFSTRDKKKKYSENPLQLKVKTEMLNSINERLIVRLIV